MSGKTLSNYGKTFVEMIQHLPKEVIEEVKKKSLIILQNQCSPEQIQELMSLFPQEAETFKKIDFSTIKAQQLIKNNDYMTGIFEEAAFFVALTKTLGSETANAVYKKIIEDGLVPMFQKIFPDPDEFANIENPFEAFKDWYMAMAKAEEEIGGHIFELAEDKPDSFRMNCQYCSRCDIFQKLGITDAYIPLCYLDDVFFPEYCKQIGFQYKRDKTLAKGDDYCNFHFLKEA